MNHTCPKCGHEQQQSNQACQRCGVIFARIRTIPDNSARLPDSPTNVSRVVLQQGEPSIVIIAKALLLLGLGVWGLRLASQPIVSNAVGESYLHLINLVFHEAGHVVFTPLGRFMQILGGTLGQLIIPAVVAGTFIYQQQPYSASVGLWWLGESFMDIAPYIDDARAGQLLLLGGVTGSEVEDYHDWEGILSRLGMMTYDHALARCAFVFGFLITITAVCWGGYILWRSWQVRDRSTVYGDVS
jgi:hypothetical protein